MHDILLTVKRRNFATHTIFVTSQFCPFTRVVSGSSFMFAGTGTKTSWNSYHDHLLLCFVPKSHTMRFALYLENISVEPSSSKQIIC